MRSRTLLLTLLTFIAMPMAPLTLSVAAAADIAPPTWPQKYDIPPGVTNTYAFPITSAGKVTVALDWAGPELEVALVDVDGKVIVSPVKQQAPKATLSFEISEAQLKDSNVFAITLTAPAAQPGAQPGTGSRISRAAKPLKVAAIPVAQGSISVKTPPIDNQALQPRLKALVDERTSRISKLKRTTVAQPKPRANATRPWPDAAAVAAMEKQAKALRSQFDSRVATQSAALQSSSRAILAAKTKSVGLQNATVVKVKLPKGAAVTAPSTKYDKPTVVSGTSDSTSGSGLGGGTGGGGATGLSGFPGDEVVLQVGGIDPNAANTVTFTVHSTMTGGNATLNPTGSIYGAVLRGDVVELTVGVPYAGNRTDPAASIVVRDPSGKASAPYPFYYRDIPLPTITAARASDGVANPGHTLVVEGSGFASGTQIYFGLPGSGNAVPVTATPVSASNPSRLSAVIPNYTSASQYATSICPAFHYMHKHFEGDFNGECFPITLDATSMALTSADRTSVLPRSTLLLGGSGFTSNRGEVHCILPGNRDLTATVQNWSDTAILVQVPDYEGIAQSVTGTISVTRTDGTRSNLLSIGFAPEMVHQLLPLSTYLVGVDWSFSKKTDSDRFAFQDNGTRVWAHHEYSFWSGTRGSDIAFFMSDYWPILGASGQMLAKYLQNGWTVSSINWWQKHSNNLLISVNHSEHLGTDNPLVRVSWEMPPFLWPYVGNSTEYSFSIGIVGPKGTSFFANPGGATAAQGASSLGSSSGSAVGGSVSAPSSNTAQGNR